MMAFKLGWSKPKHDIKAIIVYPNKQIEMKRVKVTEDKFSHEGRVFLIDEKSVYFLEKQPVSFYHFQDSSPKLIHSNGVEDSMKSKEVSAVMESKIVQDIITASGGNTDWTFYAAAASAGISLLILLNNLGLLKLGGG
jgi:hypothetical protein